MSGPMVGMTTFTTAPLVVRREKRRKRKMQDVENDHILNGNFQRSRHGFLFEDHVNDGAESTLLNAATSATPVMSVASLPQLMQTPQSSRTGERTAPDTHTFVFRVKKMQKTGDDPVKALQQKQEREARRARLKKVKDEMEHEEQYEAEVAKELNVEQLGLYRTVRYCARRELRRNKHSGQHASTRADMATLAETSLATLRTEMVAFMKANAPSAATVTVPNPENARLSALIESYEARIAALHDEQKTWEGLSTSLQKERDDKRSEDRAASHEPESIPCELAIAAQMQQDQVSALERAQASAHQLQIIEDSMQTIHRLLLQTHIKRGELFGAFQGSAFKGYMHTEQPKDVLRALFKLPFLASASASAPASATHDT